MPKRIVLLPFALREKGLGDEGKMLIADGFCSTDNPDDDDNSPHQCRPTDNIGHQNRTFACKNRSANATAANRIASLSNRYSDWGGLGRGNNATIVCPSQEQLCTLYLVPPSALRTENSGLLLRIDARVMAWHFAPQKVRTCVNTATIRPSKSGHKTTLCDAHSVATGNLVTDDL